MTYDRRTGKPIASAVTKIGPEVVSRIGLMLVFSDLMKFFSHLSLYSRSFSGKTGLLVWLPPQLRAQGREESAMRTVANVSSFHIHWMTSRETSAYPGMLECVLVENLGKCMA